MITKILYKLTGFTLDGIDMEQQIEEYTEKANRLKSDRGTGVNINNLTKLEEEIQRLHKEKEELSAN